MPSALSRESQPYGMTIFCDDIRQEVGGKVTYVGCFSGGLVIAGASFPIALPKLCLAIYYNEPSHLAPENVLLKIYLPGDDPAAPTATGELPLEAFTPPPTSSPEPGSQLFKRATAFIAIAPATIRSPGYITVRAQRGDDIVKLGSLEIIASQSLEAVQ